MEGVTAIIPARGGSVGVPRKNLCRVGGLSLLARCIRTLREAGVRRVIVSTEDDEIAAEAIRCEAEVRIRPLELAADDCPSWPVLQDAVEACHVTGTVLFVQCTAPLLTVQDVHRCVEKLAECDLAIACHACHLLLLTADGTPVNWTFPPKPRQAMQPQYAISGSVWAFDVKHAAQPDLYCGTIGVVVSEKPYRLDVDTPDDLRLANRLLPYWMEAYPQ